jgi:hypothetical protein
LALAASSIASSNAAANTLSAPGLLLRNVRLYHEESSLGQLERLPGSPAFIGDIAIDRSLFARGVRIARIEEDHLAVTGIPRRNRPCSGQLDRMQGAQDRNAILLFDPVPGVDQLA